MATEIENLSWTASKNKDWITVTPTAGTGSQDVTITITSTAPIGSSDTAGTVTFECLDCNPKKDPIIVNVTRCVETECTEWDYKYEDIEVDCHAHTSVDVQYTATCKADAAITETGSSSYTPTTKIECYNGNTDRVVQTSPFKITQKAGDCTCQDCDCENITITPSSMLWNWDSTAESSATISIDSSCSSLISITNANATGNFTASLDGNTIKVNPNGQNPGDGDDNTGSVNISYTIKGTQNTCNNKISLTQSSQGCNCNKLKFKDDKTNVSINVGGTDTVTVIPDCTTVTSVKSNNASVASASFNNATGEITITGTGNGSTTINVYYKVGETPCTPRTINVSVGCPTITITYTPETLTCEGGNVQFTARET